MKSESNIFDGEQVSEMKINMVLAKGGHDRIRCMSNRFRRAQPGSRPRLNRFARVLLSGKLITNRVRGILLLKKGSLENIYVNY